MDDLDDLAHQAEDLAAPAGDAGPGDAPGTDLVPAEAAKPTNAQLLAGALAAGREVFCSFTQFQSPKRTLTDERLGELASAWAPVLEKHGIDLNRYMGEWAPEIAAVLVTLQIGVEVRQALLLEMRERDEKRAKEEAAKPDAGAPS